MGQESSGGDEWADWGAQAEEEGGCREGTVLVEEGAHRSGCSEKGVEEGWGLGSGETGWGMEVEGMAKEGAEEMEGMTPEVEHDLEVPIL